MYSRVRIVTVSASVMAAFACGSMMGAPQAHAQDGAVNARYFSPETPLDKKQLSKAVVSNLDNATQYLDTQVTSARSKSKAASAVTAGYLLLNEIEDELGYTHTRVRRTINGIPVIGADAIVETSSEDGQLVGVFGKSNFEPGDINLKPILSSAQAVTRTIKNPLADLLAQKTALETPTLVVLASDVPSPVLCWRVLARGTEPGKDDIVYIDARTGKEVGRQQDYNSAEYTTTLNTSTVYYGQVNSLTGAYDTASGLTLMKDLTRGNSRVVDANFSGNPNYDDYSYTSYPTLSSSSNNFNFSSQSLKSSGDIWYSYQQTFDYFKNVQGLNGWNGSGAGNILVVQWPGGDAFFKATDKALRFGVTSSGAPITSSDVVAHEFTHAVVYQFAQLNSDGEPGALNESLADIFGAAVENYTRNLNLITIPTLSSSYVNNRLPADYLMGADLDGYGWRNMANPPSRSLDGIQGVDSYANILPSTGSNIRRIYNNSGIQSKVFYLLCEGGTHYSTTVAAIGRAKAEKIFFRMLTTKLTSTSNFQAARDGSIASAKELYGANSFEAAQVALAWYSVGVYSQVRERAVYFTPAAFPSQTGTISSNGATREATAGSPQGFLVYGPYYANTRAGYNQAQFQLEVDNNTADNLNIVRVEVVDATLGTVLTQRNITRKEFRAANTPQEFVVDTNLPASGHQIELRVWYYSNSFVRLHGTGLKTAEWNMASVSHPTSNTGQGRFESDGTYSCNTSQDVSTYMQYGPYANNVEVGPGRQKAYWYLQVDNNTADNHDIVRLEVVDATLGTVVTQRVVTRAEWAAANTAQRFELPFQWDISRAGHMIELRVLWYGYSYVKEYSVGLEGQP